MLVLYGAQVIGILLYLAKLQAKGVDIVDKWKLRH